MESVACFKITDVYASLCMIGDWTNKTCCPLIGKVREPSRNNPFKVFSSKIKRVPLISIVFVSPSVLE